MKAPLRIRRASTNARGCAAWIGSDPCSLVLRPGPDSITGMKVIRTFYGPEEAYATLSFLHAHGKNARLLDENTLSVLPLDSVALGGYRLAVPDEEAASSLLLLGHDRRDEAASKPVYFGDEAPTERGAISLRRRFGRWLLLALLSLVIVNIVASLLTRPPFFTRGETPQLGRVT